MNVNGELDYPYRIFVTFAHDDEALATLVEQRLTGLGVTPLLARALLEPGANYANEIQEWITHAHALLPILTKESMNRPWPNHEMAFALAVGTPIMPICIDTQPEGLIERVQALTFKDEEEFIKDPDKKFNVQALTSLLVRGQSPNVANAPIYKCAEFRDERTRILTDYLERLQSHLERMQRFKITGRVRMWSTFCSFCLPNEDVHHPDWRVWRGEMAELSKDSLELLLGERKLLGDFAKKYGCDLIINPSVPLIPHGRNAHIKRLELLRSFLCDMEQYNDRIQVATWYEDERMPRHQIIVGDWFLADATAPVGGGSLEQTIFTRHAPTIIKRNREFDQRLNSLLAITPLNGRSSREYAIDHISECINHIESGEASDGVHVLAETSHLRFVERCGWSYVQRTKATGVVCILAVTEEGKLLLVEQLRQPVNRRVVELPAGLAGDLEGSEQEPLEDAARRELLEETGYEAESLHLLADAPSSAGVTDETVKFFLAEGLKRIHAGGGDNSENIHVHQIALDEIDDWLQSAIARRRLIDAKIYAGLYFLERNRNATN